MNALTAPATLADIKLFLRDIIFGKHVSAFHPGMLFAAYTWGNGTRKFNDADAAKLDAHLATCEALCATLGTSLARLSFEYTSLVYRVFALRIGESQPVVSLADNSRCLPTLWKGTLSRTREGYVVASNGVGFISDNLGYLPDTAANRATLKALAAQLNKDFNNACDAQMARIRQLA